MIGSDDLRIGTAAEHLVCADLLLAGYRAFRADQQCPYDVAVEHNGRLIRIQVKATRKPRALPQRRMPTSAYLFHVRRAGKRGKRRYGEGEFDALALVALDILRIAYLPIRSVRQSVHIRVPGVVYDDMRCGPGRNFDDLGFAACL